MDILRAKRREVLTPLDPLEMLPFQWEIVVYEVCEAERPPLSLRARRAVIVIARVKRSTSTAACGRGVVKPD